MKKAINLKKKFKIKKVYPNIYEMNQKEKPQGVIIATSVEATKKVLKKCLKFNWKILVEKPLGYNLKEFYKIKKFSRNEKKKIFIALNRNHFGSTLLLKKKIKNYKSRRIIFVQDQENNLFKNHEYSKKVIKNWMFANSIHLIDYFRIFGRGKILKVKTYIKNVSKNQRIVNSEINFSSGDIGIYKCFWNLCAPWAVSIIFKNERFELKPLEVLNYYLNAKKKNIFLPKSNDLKYKPGFKIQISKFLKKISGSNLKLLPNITDCEFTMKLIDKIYRKK